MKGFLQKQEQEKQTAKQDSLIKQHAKQLDLYSKMLAMQKREQNRSKRKRYYDYDDSDSSDYEESIKDD